MPDPAINPSSEHLPPDQFLQEAGYPFPEPVPADPPGQGKFPLPHFLTFAQLTNLVSRSYRFTFDEALRHSQANALAMRRDGVVMEALRARQMPTCQLAWHIEPQDDKDERQVAAVGDVTKDIEAIPNFQQFRRMLLEGVWWGRYGVQTIPCWSYDTGEKRLRIRDYRPINGDKLVFRFSGQVGLLVHATYTGDWAITDRGRAHFFSPEERETLIIHHHEPEDADFFQGEMAGAVYGVGIRHRVYWLWWLKSQVIAWMMDYLERVGAGGFTIYYYEHGNAESLTEVRNAAEQQFRNNSILFPRYRDNSTGGPGVERVEPNNAGAALIQSIISQYFDAAIRRYILGQDLSSGTAPTGLGSGVADLHDQTFARIIKYDSTDLDQTLTKDLLPLFYKYNHPGVPCGRFVSDLNKPNAAEILEGARSFYEMGGTIDENELRDILGLSEPEKGHNLLAKIAPVSPAGVGALPTGVPMEGQPGPMPPGSPPGPQGAPTAPQGGPQALQRSGRPLRLARAPEMGLLDLARQSAGRFIRAGRRPKTPEEKQTARFSWIDPLYHGYFSPEEMGSLTKATAEKLNKHLTGAAVPERVEDVKTAAKVGRSARNWYPAVAEALHHLFPDNDHDKGRFATLLAATSPRVDVLSNLIRSLDLWHLWELHGRPQGPALDRMIKGIRSGNLPHPQTGEPLIKKTPSDRVDPRTGREIISTEMRLNGEWVPSFGVFATHIPGIKTALGGKFTGEELADPRRSDILGSGTGAFKTNNFRQNLMGNLFPVTGDMWESRYKGLAAKDMRKAATYLFSSYLTRKAAEGLTQETGEHWSPAHVQGAGWTGFQALVSLQDNPAQSLDELADRAFRGRVGEARDFVSYLTEHPDAVNRLHALGFDQAAAKLSQIAHSLRNEPPGERGTVGTGSGSSFERLANRAARFTESKKRHEQIIDRKRREAAARRQSSSPFDQKSRLARSDPAGMVFASPSTEQDLSFDQALDRLHSANQQEAHKVAHQVLKGTGIKDYRLRDAVGDWEGGAENALVHAIYDPITPEHSKYLASFIGQYLKQRGMIAFHSHEDGPDSVYEIPTRQPDVQKVREALSRNGVPLRSILPGPKGATVILWDQGRQLRPKVAAFAAEHHATIHETSGTGYPIGGPTRATARAAYRDVIKQTEGGLSSRPKSPEGTSPSRRPRSPKKLARRQAPAGTGQISRGVFYPPGEFVPEAPTQYASKPRRTGTNQPDLSPAEVHLLEGLWSKGVRRA
jgi:hypothetical protein